MGKLDGRTALITGGSSGMALTTAKLFVDEGASVVITGRDQDRLDDAVAELGPDATGVLADASKLDEIDHLMTTVRAAHGHLDVLFSSVGAWSHGPLETVTDQDYQTTFDVTVRGTLFTVQKALPLLRDNASVVLNASVASIKGLPDGTVYNASKAAVRSFARTWAAELSHRRIRFNVVSPGPIDTPAFRQGPPALREQRRTAIPRGELGRPSEVASVVLFLACDDSSFVNGMELFVDGGITQI